MGVLYVKGDEAVRLAQELADQRRLISEEPEAPSLTATLTKKSTRLTSGLAVWEATLAVARLTANGVEVAQAAVRRFCSVAKLTIVPVGAAEATEAVHAHMRYGKGNEHLAKLSMGECFAYACTKTNGARLLYRGDDVARTEPA